MPCSTQCRRHHKALWRKRQSKACSLGQVPSTSAGAAGRACTHTPAATPPAHTAFILPARGLARPLCKVNDMKCAAACIRAPNPVVPLPSASCPVLRPVRNISHSAQAHARARTPAATRNTAVWVGAGTTPLPTPHATGAVRAPAHAVMPQGTPPCCGITPHRTIKPSACAVCFKLCACRGEDELACVARRTSPPHQAVQKLRGT